MRRLLTRRGLAALAALFGGGAFCATFWVELIVNRHYAHVAGLFIGGVTFLLVLGAALALFGWARGR